MLTGRRFGCTRVMSCPSRTMRPSVGISNPASMRSNVVLPQPEGPRRAKNSLLAMSRLTPSTAVTPPGKRLVMLWNWMIEAGVMSGGASLVFGCLGRRLHRHGKDRHDGGEEDERGRGGVDLGRHAEPYHRIDQHWECHRVGAGGEEGDDEVVERQGEGEESARDDAR